MIDLESVAFVEFITVFQCLEDVQINVQKSERVSVILRKSHSLKAHF